MFSEKIGSVQEKLSSLLKTYFGFFLKDEDFVSHTINDSNIDLDKFPSQ